MDAKDVVIRTEGGGDAEEVEAIESVQHGIEARDLFGVAGQRDMAEAFGMGKERDLHGRREQDAQAAHKGVIHRPTAWTAV